MARKVLIEGYGYAFNPTTRTVTIQKFIPEERLILITNVSKNKVIYNFSDPSLGYSNYQTSFDPTTGNEQTVVTLIYDTTVGMESGNQLQILIDEDAQLITPSQTYMDPTNKMRVVTPQSLIDTDFEYGTQFSKWETQGLIGNRPYFYPSATQVPNITAITQPLNSRTVTVTTSSAHALVIGTPLVVLDTFFGPSNGNFVIESTTSTTFTFTSRAANNTSSTDILDPNKTALYQGSIFANSPIGTAPSSFTYDSTTGAVVVTTSVPHGLAIGNEIAMIGTAGLSAGTSGLSGAAVTLNGNYVVNQINSATQFTYHAPVGFASGPGRGAINSASVVATNAAAIATNSSGLTNQITVSAYSTASTDQLQIGQIVSGTNIPVGTVISALNVLGSSNTITGATGSGSLVTFTTGSNHGYSIGQSVTIAGVAPAAYNITGVITSTPAPNTFTIANSATGSFSASGVVNPVATITLSNVTTGGISSTVSFFAAVYVRPQAQTNHRPFDGGVLFSNNSLSNFSTNIRQSRRYFRYQSGKGIQVSSGTILKPYSGLDQINGGATITNASGNGIAITYTANNHTFVPGQSVTITGVSPAGFNLTGTVASVTTNTFNINNTFIGTYVSGGFASSLTFTIQTKERHNLLPGTSVILTGSSDVNYNGTFTVSQILGWNRYQVTGATVLPTVSPAPGNPAISVNNWSGSSTRLGMFDNQNGIFFEYDGSTLNAVRRSSTFQLAGKVTVAFNSPYVEQTDPIFATQFASQLTPGDFVTIRGFSYRVTDILSNSQILISPSYRGINAQNVTISKTVDTRVPQSLWNLDRMDGTGNSGYSIDLSKMQMFYVDYTWYGAGFVRWGLRGVKGDVTYAHKMPNNNVNTEAYMRSGNLPARYEINNTAPITVLSSGIDAVQTTIPVVDASRFPSSGTVAIRQVTLTAPTSSIGSASVSGGIATFNTGVTTGITIGQPIRVTGLTDSRLNGTFTVNTITTNTNFTAIVALPNFSISSQSGTWATQNYSTTVEYINYSGRTNTSLTGVTRARAGNPTTGVTLTIAANTSLGTVVNATTLQPGMRVVGATNADRAGIPENTFIVSVSGNTVNLSNALTVANPSVLFIPMGASSGQSFSNVSGNPVEVELAFPSFSPTISHWGTSVIMDGRFDDDKSLLFTYGQQQQTALGSFSGYYYITSISGNGTQVTYNTSDTTGLIAGNPIAIANASVAGFNGNYTILSVNPNVSFTVANATQGSATTANASFGTPATTQYAGIGGSTQVTFPNLVNAVVGQTVAGDTTRFPLNTPVRISSITTSQPNQITSISSESSTQTISAVSIGTTTALSLTNIVGNGSLAVATLVSPNSSFVPGALVTIATNSNAGFNGTFTIANVISSTQFTFANTTNATGTGGTANANTGIVTFTVPSTSGIYAGQPITIAGDTGITALNGTFLVDTVPNTTTFTIRNGAFGTSAGTRTATVNTATYYTSGVDATGSNIVQTPTAITGSGTAVTVTVPSTAGITVGALVTVANVTTTTAYNGTFVVSSIVNATQFTYTSTVTGTAGLASSPVVTVIPIANRYVTIQGATTAGYNGTFLTVQSIPALSFTVVTPTLVVGQSSTAQAIVYTGVLSQAVGGTGAHNQFVSLYGANTKALFSIRIAPSVDNGTPAALGAREVINRMQLVLKALGITTTVPATGNPPINLLAQAILNGIPTTTTPWTSVTRNQVGVANSSLSMIADYAGTNTFVNGGEITGGFVTDGTGTLDLGSVRDLGNSILGGGGTTSNTNIFPDGPDTLTIIATNLSQTPLLVAGRLSWTEAQA